ncbi:sporulation/spore germination protein [Limnofasciculus baicalensis]|uniref:Sporulation/spore germination protein n=1 Tax=Limnofasciculus baicalensis BBK-W-15 TaxID=2699891 RepID=A0AAE3GV41_9CYAN|nr:sporulation/spore germination protein [Limnofasciculus baicalensis]MCP2731255.1 sporulation/spore germination protein [Limnofasciculus baicalensis BBK-W-15]
MKIVQQYLAPLVIGVFCAGFSSYHILAASEGEALLQRDRTISSSSGTVATTQVAPSPSPLPTDIAVKGTNEAGNLSINNNNNTISLNIYHPDSQCETLIPEKVAVSADTPVTNAVGKVLELATSSDFDLAGYRVNLDLNKRVVTIDFRLSPNTKRQFVSLSTCEQFALFGTLRKTLIDNPQLKIKDVRFTNQGQEIKL